MTIQRNYEGFIGVLAIVSIILIAIDLLVDLEGGWLLAVYAMDLMICIVFAWDFGIRLWHAEKRITFLKLHGYEILAMVPALALYFAGSTAVSMGLRSIRLIRVIRVLLLLARQARFFSAAGRFVQRSGLVWLSIATVSVILVGGLLVFLLEYKAIDAQITNFSDAIWWSISTVTTVGYGDIVPNTILGRIIGMLLMIIGIGAMSAFISQISATLVEARFKRNDGTESLEDSLASEIKYRIDRIDTLTDNEANLLMNMIRNLRDKKKNG